MMEKSASKNQSKTSHTPSEDQTSYFEKRLQHQLNKHAGQSFISGGTFVKMLFYIVLMAVAPISAYYYSKKYIFEEYFEFSEGDSIVPAAFSAVFVVNVVLVLFIITAYMEKVPDKRKTD